MSATSGLDEQIERAWKHYGRVHCDSCGVDVDLSGASDEAEARQLWNDHVDESGGDRYV